MGSASDVRGDARQHRWIERWNSAVSTVAEARWCAFKDALEMNVEDGFGGRTSGLTEDGEVVERIRQLDELSDDEVGWPR